MNGSTTRRGMRFIAGLLGMGVLLGLSLTGMACSCAPPLEIGEALEDAQAVFSGRVVGLRLVPLEEEDPTLPAGIEELEVSFAVQTVWKGETVETLVVRTGFTCCVCGYPFVIGAGYVVYACDSIDGGLSTSFCTRTHLLDSQTNDVSVLNELVPVAWSAPEA